MREATLMFTKTSASIVLVEDHTILREGLRALIELEPDLKVVGEASTAAEGVRLVRGSSPTLVITDLAMPGGSGLRTIDELRAVCPNVRVLVLTAYCTDEHIVAALGAGADGYMLKDASRAELLQAIRSVIAGQKYFSKPVSARLVSGYLRRNDPASDPCPRITEREREVLTRIALGESSKRVAMALCLSVKTVEKHRANLMRKLALHNTAALTLFAVRNGLLPTQDAERCFAEVELTRFRGRLEVGSGAAGNGAQDGLIPAAV
ncbi:MAG: response regulator transcription factor [Gammaproteobacteria bacterium]|nr:MAG: response regulator transcription factor [Gammaproteobacteria bacterium]TLY69957.1 MAG: response regulator transcription factor [Gammaproteobacteria bacterium]TLY86237.1 MAG: response regulator transcription factor [Gammaproteobacteria bacterium]